jgi:hypothetical protein
MNGRTYPDTAAGARDLLLREADPRALPGIEGAKATPDPAVKGCWLVEGEGWRAVVYVGPHPVAPDFEVEDG